jgi:ESS family glutamate:Na+ symporter
VTVRVGSPELLILAVAALALGFTVRRRVALFERLSLPAPVVGGFVASVLGLALWYGGITLEFEPLLRNLLMVAFFTTVGLAARFDLIRVGGPALVLLLAISAVVAALQNVVGMVVAHGIGAQPLLGIIAGSVTLAGGPATGLAFGPRFEELGVHGASSFALASATLGIIAGGLFGGPLATLLIRRHHLVHKNAPPAPAPRVSVAEARGLLPELAALAVAMAAGAWLSHWISARGVVLPSYIGAMLVAALLRNGGEALGVPLSSEHISRISAVSLNLFIAMALVGLRLWELRGLGGPLIAILAVQIVFLLALSYLVVYRLMGADYQSAVIAGGFVGYMLGITPNAMANMEALVEKYGPAPRAYLIVPLVAAFLIDFANALIISEMARWAAH